MTKDERVAHILRAVGSDNKWVTERLKEEGYNDTEIVQLIANAPKPERKRRGAKEVRVLTPRAQKINMGSVPPEAISWLWEKRIPMSSVTICAGDPGIGKSLMVLDIAGRGSTGKEFLDGKPAILAPFKTLLLAMEDDRASIIVPRLQAMGANLAAIEAVDMVEFIDETETVTEERIICLESDVAIMRKILEEDREIKLVIVDPLSNYMGTKSMHRDQELRTVLMPLVQLSREMDVAIITILHNSKQTGRSALAKVAVALGAIGVVRIAWSFVEDGDSCLMLQMKKNLGKFSGIRYTTESIDMEIAGKKTSQALLKFVEESTVSIDSILTSSEDVDERKEKPAVALLQRMVPKNGEVAAKIVQAEAEKLGISYKQLTTGRTRLGIVSFQKRGTKNEGHFWRWDDGASIQAPHPADDPDGHFPF